MNLTIESSMIQVCQTQQVGFEVDCGPDLYENVSVKTISFMQRYKVEHYFPYIP